MLVATNFFGQNTPAIMATEALYAEMWAQDAAAMYGYAGAASAASTLTAFTTPPETTNPAGLAGLAAAVTQAAGTSAGTGVQTVSPLTSAVSTPLTSAAMPSALQGLASTATSFVVIVAAVVLDDPDFVVDGSDVGDEPGVGRGHVRIDVDVGPLDARLGGFAH